MAMRTTIHQFDIITTDCDAINEQTHDLTYTIDSRTIYNVTDTSFDADIRLSHDDERHAVTFTRYPEGDAFEDQVGPDSDE